MVVVGWWPARCHPRPIPPPDPFPFAVNPPAVVYPGVEGESVGVPIAGKTAFATLDSAKTACQADRECVGMTGGPSGWSLFAGALREGAVGKVRAVGEAINPWMPAPTGLA
jgi:hypothetical protein